MRKQQAYLRRNLNTAAAAPSKTSTVPGAGTLVGAAGLAETNVKRTASAIMF